MAINYGSIGKNKLKLVEEQDLNRMKKKKINIISVGKLSKVFKTIAAEYEKMIKWKIGFSEINYTQKLPEGQIKQFEAKKIIEHLNLKNYTLALEIRGDSLNSFEFSEIFNIDKNIDFVIGGAYGLDPSILNIVNAKISLSSLTFPHQMVKVILLEQIYRAQTILENHPYHK